MAIQTQLLRGGRGKRETIEPGLFPGLLLNAAPSSRGAFEGHWNGFSAGLFTYALTQQLWWLTTDTSLAAGISLAGAKVEQVIGNQREPMLSGQRSDKLSLENHKFQPTQSMSADGVVVGTSNETAGIQVFLGGLPATVLENYGVMSLLQLIDANGNAQSTDLAINTAVNRENPASSDAPMSVVDQSYDTPPISDAPSNLSDSSSANQSGSVINADRTEPIQASSPSSDPQASINLASSVESSADKQQPSIEAKEAKIVQVRLRDGLLVRVKPLHAPSDASRITVGQLAHERVRVVSKNINLVVALDSQLERIERVDATSALSGIARMSSVVSGEQPADILFGKAKAPQSSTPSQSSADKAPPTQDSASPSDSRSAEGKGYGLFYLSQQPIQNTIESSEEAVKTAVNRLAPKLRNLLALKLLRITDNQGSSQLGVRATLELMAPQERILIQQTTFRAPWDPPDNRLAKLFAGDGVVPSLSVGSTIRYRLQNYSDRPVYCVLLGLDARGNAIAISPSLGTGKGPGEMPQASDSIILPGDILTMPQANQSAEWVVGGPVGLADTYIETYAIFSRSPLKRTTEALSKEMRPMGNFRQLSLVSNPLDVVQSLLMDLNEASRKNMIPGADISSDAYALNMQSYASLSFVYRVV
jgi:hypothetical protein